MSVTLGSGWTRTIAEELPPPDAVLERDPVTAALLNIRELLETLILREQAPLRLEPPPVDFSSITSVLETYAPADAAAIGAAVAAAIRFPDPPVQDTSHMQALLDALSKLDFRMKGTGGGGSLSPDITDRAGRLLGIVDANLGQSIDANNTTTRTAADGATQFVGDWTRTRSVGVVRELTVLASTVTSGLGGTFIFEYSEDGSTATISESRTITDFATVRDFDLLNAGEYYRIKFTPSRALTGAEMVFITTTLRRQNDGQFVRLANQQIEEANAALGETFAYLKAFDSTTGKSVNIRPTTYGDLRVGFNAHRLDDLCLTAAPIAVAGSIATPYMDVKDFASVLISTDVDVLIEGYAEWSIDGVTAHHNFTTPFLGAGNFNVPIGGRYLRIRAANLGASTAHLTVEAYGQYQAPTPFLFPAAAPVDGSFPAALSKSIGTAANPDGSFTNARSQGTDSGNSTTTLLGANEVYRGTWFPWQASYVKVVTDMQADVAGTLYIDFSEALTPVDGDDSSVDDTVTLIYNPAVTPLLKRHSPVQSRWYRHRYVNGPAAQSLFNLDSALVTADPGVPMQAYSLIPRMDSQAGLIRNIPAIGDGTGLAYHELPVDTAGVPKTHITSIDDDLLLRGLPTAQVRQFVIGTSPLQLDTSKLASRRSVSITNDDPTTTVWIGHSGSIASDSGTFPIFPKGEKSRAYGVGVDIWAVVANTGGVQTVLNRAGSSASGTATSPSNALTSDNTRATLTSAQTVTVSGATAGTTNALVSVKLCAEAQKQTGQFEQATFLDVTTGNAGNVGTVATSGTVPAAALMTYVAYVSRENVATVTGVTGLGLTWTQVTTEPSDDAKRTLDCWIANGSPLTAGIVTASFSAVATNSHIAVLRCSGVDQSSPVQDSDIGRANSNAPTVPALTSTNKGLVLMGVAQASATATPGAGYTERSDEQSASGTIDGLSTETKQITATGTETPTATLSASKHWAAIGVTLTPAAAYDPIVTLSYTLSAITGATTGAVTVTSGTDTTQKVDITADRTWVYGDIANIAATITGTTITGAAVLIDQLYVEVTDTTANVVRIAMEELA